MEGFALPKKALKRGFNVKKSSESALRKVKNFVADNYKKIGNILLVAAILIALSVGALLILSALDVVYYDDGLHMTARTEELIHGFINTWYGWIIIILLQVGITILLCFVPGVSMMFIMFLVSIAPTKISAFLIAFIGVMVTSLLMYFTGRLGGYAICAKLLGKEDCAKASRLLNNRGVVFFPLMMLFPIFPDDALVMIAGTLRMSLKWFIPSIVVCRGIGIAAIVFGISSIPFDKFTTPWHWILFILECAVGIVAIFWAANRLSLYLEKRSSDKKVVRAALAAPAELAKLPAHEDAAVEAEREAPVAEKSVEAQTDNLLASDEETTI